MQQRVPKERKQKKLKHFLLVKKLLLKHFDVVDLLCVSKRNEKIQLRHIKLFFVFKYHLFLYFS